MNYVRQKDEEGNPALCAQRHAVHPRDGLASLAKFGGATRWRLPFAPGDRPAGGDDLLDSRLGSQVEVLEPAWLRTHIAAEAKTTAILYEGGKG